MSWLAVMCLLLPLMASHDKLRAWVIVFLAGIIASICPYSNFPLFIFIDIVAGLAIISHPMGLPQRIIALIYVAMLCIHGGTVSAIVSRGAADFYCYATMERILGWAQLATLFVWGGIDAIRYCANRTLFGQRHFHHVGGLR